MANDQNKHYRVIGGQLALYLRQREGSWPSTAILQGMTADLVGVHTELALPLRELVSRLAFRALAEKAGSGSGQLERDALLQDLQGTFAPAVVAGLAEVLNGLLDLPSGSPSPSPSIPAEPSAQKSEISSSIEPSRSVDESRPPGKAPFPWHFLLLLCFGTSSVAAGSVVLLRYSPLCGVFGLCPRSAGVGDRPSALEAASAAVDALRRVGSVEAYAAALEQLDRELLKLSGDPLSLQQQQQLNALHATARSARQTLQAERADQEALTRAGDAISAAKATPASDQTPQLTAARQGLDAISPRSFSAAEASRLSAELDALLRRAAAAAEPALSGQATPTAQAPLTAPPAPPQRMSPPPPASQPEAAPTPSAPYRDQPLF